MKSNNQKFKDAVKQNLENNIYNHSLSLEACMLGLYDYFSTNNLLDTNEPTREEWGIAGLIHDIDFASDTKELHPLKTREVLARYGLEISDTIQQLILAHDGRQNIKMDSKAKWSIFCADSLTGLITAVAFVYPDRKLSSVKVSSVLKRFLKEPKFAAGTRRDEVSRCAEPLGLNMPIGQFIEICLISMQKIAPEIGL